MFRSLEAPTTHSGRHRVQTDTIPRLTHQRDLVTETIRRDDSSDSENVAGRDKNRVNAQFERNSSRHRTRYYKSVNAESGIPFSPPSSRINTEFRDSLGMGLPRGRNLEVDDEFYRESSNHERLERATSSLHRINSSRDLTTSCWPCRFCWKVSRSNGSKTMN